MKAQAHTIPVRSLCTAETATLLVPVALLSLFGFSLAVSANQTGGRVYSHDNSDWWSGSRTVESNGNIRTHECELPQSNFQILGVELSEDMFTEAASKLGPTTIIERGDAATGRSQACYVSDRGARRIYLIFEQDEVGFTFYVFSGGRPWNGSDQCVHSRLISATLSTASGLHLGQTPSDVMGILGQPTNRSKDGLIYSVHAKKRASPENLKRLREMNTQLSDEDFHKAYDFYDLSANVHAKFVDSKLAFLAISKAETN